MGIKREIDTLCKDLLMSNVNEYISVPIVLMVCLGEKTHKLVNASLRDAFTTSFKAEPNVFDIKMDSTDITADDIVGQIVSVVSNVKNLGRPFDDIRIAFVSLMDDPIYDSNYMKLIETLQDAMKQCQDFRLPINKISYYGIFQQIEMRGNYKNAFQFVNAGKMLWKNIYHIEIPIFDDNIHTYTKLIAINVISDDQMVNQDVDSPEYNWISLCLHYLKVPELIVAKVLRKVYANQINGQNVNLEEWEANVEIELEKVFAQKFTNDDYQCEQFIPLYYYDEEETEIKKPSLFGKIFSKQKDNTGEMHDNPVILEQNSISQLLQEMYGAIAFSDDDYRQIMEQIISAASSIDNNHNKISQSVRQFLNKKVTDLEQQLENLITKSKFAVNENRSNATLYVHGVYEGEKKKLILQKKIELINTLVEHLLEGGFLNQLIQEICEKNRGYTNKLDELSQNEYGGTLEHENINMTVLPSFKVNQSVDEIIRGIGNDLLSKIINDEDTIYANLQQFLNHTLGNAMVVASQHNLGEVNGTYNMLEPVNAALLVTPAKENEARMQQMLSAFPSVYTKSNSLYRENTFYMISSRVYSSDQYIVRYKRG